MRKNALIAMVFALSACGPRAWFSSVQLGRGGTITVVGGHGEDRLNAIRALGREGCPGGTPMYGYAEHVTVSEACSISNGQGGYTTSTCQEMRTNIPFSCR